MSNARFTRSDKALVSDIKDEQDETLAAWMS